MPKYRFDVKLTGFEEITVEADDEEAAREKALDKFEAHYSLAPARDLRQKVVELDNLDADHE